MSEWVGRLSAYQRFTEMFLFPNEKEGCIAFSGEPVIVGIIVAFSCVQDRVAMNQICMC